MEVRYRRLRAQRAAKGAEAGQKAEREGKTEAEKGNRRSTTG